MNRRGHKRKASALLSLFAALGISQGSRAFADWRPTGPFGGDAAIVRAVPGAPGLVIAAARNGLLFRSTNGGASWSSLSFTGQFAGVLHALEVDPRREREAKDTWYIGMEGERQSTSGVYKTTDAGSSWKLLPGMKGKAVWSLALFPANPDLIAAGTSDGVYRSADAGVSWTRNSPADNTDLRPVVSLAFDPADSDILYAGTTHLPWRTRDGGSTWTSIHTGMLDDSDVFSIQVDGRNSEIVYASACSGVYRSGDGASHWAKLSTPQGLFRTYFVAIDPRHDRDIFAGTSEGLLRSEDGGRAFRQVSPHAVKSISFDPSVPERIFFASTTGGILVSTDGGKTLHESNFGFSNRNFTAITGAGRVVYANTIYEPGSGGVYRTDDLGLRWRRSGNEPAGQEILSMSAAPEDPATLFAAGYHGLLKSADGGKTWVTQKGPAAGAAGQIRSIAALGAGTLLVATDHGIYRGSAATWQAVTPPGMTPAGIQSLQRSGKNIVAALWDKKAYVSNDGARTWVACGPPSPSAVWYGLAFDAATGARASQGANTAALGATSEGLFRSGDGCLTWSKIGRGLQSDTVSVVLFHPTRAGEAFVSQGGTVFRSTDAGLSWSHLNDEGRGASWPSALLVLPAAPETLFALFPRRGIFSNTVEGASPETTQ